jgi:ADP-ribose pyrophosphatase YjhB (NUDIX family)
MQEGKYRQPPYRFCPWCSQPLPGETPFRQECSACGFVLVHHSNPCVGAMPLDDGDRVLLGRRGIEPFRGDWNVIGGFLNYGEDPYEGLRREVKEELGVDCEVGGFVAAAPDWYGPGGCALLNLYFRVRLLGGELRAQDDVSEFQWFPLNTLPGNIAFRSDRTALQALQAAARRSRAKRGREDAGEQG